jgi:GPI mannosyltransferase 2
MLCSAKKQWIAAAFYFSVAGAFRSNGVLLAGFIIWGLVAQAVLDGKRVRLMVAPH